MDSASAAAALIQEYAAPRYDVFYPTETWSEILPGLWLGGTDQEDDLSAQNPGKGFGMPEPRVTKDRFDTVVTLYAWARPADWFVKELRLGILDGPMSDFDLDAVRDLVEVAYADWASGKRVLFRCQAGINRSSLLMGLLLIKHGMDSEAAIDLMRQKRGMAVLANSHFSDFLHRVDAESWRSRGRVFIED